MQTQGSSDAIPSLSPCAKLSSVLHMTAVKCRMKTGAAPRLWVVGMRCHSKENYGWPKERHNRVHACWLRFCFMLLGDLEDASLS